jgi:Cu/Ag efflux pump CusA
LRKPLAFTARYTLYQTPLDAIPDLSDFGTMRTPFVKQYQIDLDPNKLVTHKLSVGDTTPIRRHADTPTRFP